MALSTSCAGRFRTQLDCLATVLAGTSEGALERKPIPDKWSAKENLAHLARYHEVFLDRLRQILKQDRPELSRYKAEDDPQWPNWRGLPASEVMERLRRLRAQLVAQVEGLSDGDLNRIGRHSRFGEMALAQWLEFFLLHEAHHLLLVMQRVRE